MVSGPAEPRLDAAKPQGPGGSDVDAAARELDVELARLGRCEAQLRLRIGELLDALVQSRGQHELGFSSIGAYVAERCQRTASWGRETRGLAKRIRERGLSSIRRALRSGRLGWSMAELLVRHAKPENEEALIAEAVESTVRAMQARLTGAPPESVEPSEEIDLRSVHAVSADELLMMEASRMLVEYLTGARASDEMLATALLGEAETSLQLLEDATIEDVVLPRVDAASLEAALAAMKVARSRRSRAPEVEPQMAPVLVEVIEDQPLPATPAGLYREIVWRCRELAERNLRIGRLAQRLFASRAWRRLGYASAEQYARERVGVSLSSLEHRATLARRTAGAPALSEALEGGEIGYEAALLIGRVVGPSRSQPLAKAWIDRAKERTYKHLREEVDAVMLGTSLASGVSREPPSAEDLEAVAELERRVQSGELFRSLLGARTPGPQMSVTLVPVPVPVQDEPGSDPSSRLPLRPLRLTLPVELHLHWQRVEAQFQAVASRRASFVGFLCFNLWNTWLPFLEARKDKWLDVYRRDRHRCSSPVCRRRDVTPHHVVFQAHGGTDEPENMLSLCSWCHLHGIHRGRLEAEGRAPSVRWVVGREPVMVVDGRERAAV